MLAKSLLILIIIFIAIIAIFPLMFRLLGIDLFERGMFTRGGQQASPTLVRSSDGGEQWIPVAISEERRVRFPATVLDLSFHPSNADSMYAGTKGGGLWQSVNGGASWHRVLDRERALDPTADVYKAIVAPSRTDVIYVAAFQQNRGRVLRSHNGGLTFREIYFVTANGFGVFDMYVDPFNEDHVLIATGQGGLLETYNAGITWRVVKWFGQPLLRLFVNAALPLQIYVTTRNDILLRTLDGGAHWVNVRTASESGKLLYPPAVFTESPWSGLFNAASSMAFAYDPSDFFTLWRGARDGLFRSSDGGLSWNAVDLLIPPSALPVSAIAIHPRRSSLVFVAAAQYVQRSRDAGATWSAKSLPFSLTIKQLYVHPLRPEIIFGVMKK